MSFHFAHRVALCRYILVIPYRLLGFVPMSRRSRRVCSVRDGPSLQQRCIEASRLSLLAFFPMNGLGKRLLSVYRKTLAFGGCQFHVVPLKSAFLTGTRGI